MSVLKTTIENVKGAEAFPADRQKLIYQGKILEDDKPLSEYGVKEGIFIVCMIGKPVSNFVLFME